MAGSAGGLSRSTTPSRGPSTILDVAAAAGVSRQTVTRAMNGMTGISAVTRERVLAVAAELAYRPSRHARGLVRGGTRQLGLVVPDLTNPFAPELSAAIARAAARRSWNVLLADSATSPDPRGALRELADQVDAVVGYVPDSALEALAGVPMVRLDPGVDAPGPCVRIDPRPAIELLADHLVENGVRHPAIIDAGAGASERGSWRGGELRAALERRGYLPAVESAEEASPAGGFAATERLLARGRRLDAIVAFNDVMALGVLGALRRAGRAVPDDVRVAGVDGLAIGAYVAPALTTLALDYGRVADEALELVLDVADGREPSELVRTVQNSLLLRESA